MQMLFYHYIKYSWIARQLLKNVWQSWNVPIVGILVFYCEDVEKANISPLFACVNWQAIIWNHKQLILTETASLRTLLTQTGIINHKVIGWMFFFIGCIHHKFPSPHVIKQSVTLAWSVSSLPAINIKIYFYDLFLLLCNCSATIVQNAFVKWPGCPWFVRFKKTNKTKTLIIQFEL